MEGKKNVDYILGGDMNIDYSKSSKAKERCELIEAAFGMTQYIQVPTRPLYYSAVIDLIFTNMNDVADACNRGR